MQSLKYGKDVAALQNYPAPQPSLNFRKLMRDTETTLLTHQEAVGRMRAARESKGFTARTSARAGGAGASGGKEKYLEQRKSAIRYVRTGPSQRPFCTARPGLAQHYCGMHDNEPNIA